MAKWLKEGIDAGGFAIYKKKGEGRKGNTMGVACTHLLSFLILKKRQHWERISHWFDLKGKGKGGTQEKLEKKVEYNAIPRKQGLPVCLDKGVSPKAPLSDKD